MTAETAHGRERLNRHPLWLQVTNNNHASLVKLVLFPRVKLRRTLEWEQWHSKSFMTDTAALTSAAGSRVCFKTFAGRQREFSGKELLTLDLVKISFKWCLLSAWLILTSQLSSLETNWVVNNCTAQRRGGGSQCAKLYLLKTPLKHDLVNKLLSDWSIHAKQIHATVSGKRRTRQTRSKKLNVSAICFKGEEMQALSAR